MLLEWCANPNILQICCQCQFLGSAGLDVARLSPKSKWISGECWDVAWLVGVFCGSHGGFMLWREWSPADKGTYCISLSGHARHFDLMVAKQRWKRATVWVSRSKFATWLQEFWWFCPSATLVSSFFVIFLRFSLPAPSILVECTFIERWMQRFRQTAPRWEALTFCILCCATFLPQSWFNGEWMYLKEDRFLYNNSHFPLNHDYYGRKGIT